MSLKDKLEIGLKPDAPYRPDNLPEFQQDDPDCAEAAEPGDGPEQQEARERCTSKKRVRAESAVGPEEEVDLEFIDDEGEGRFNETR